MKLPRWTDKEDSRLLELLKTEPTAKEIANKLGVSKNSVIGRLSRIGYSAPGNGNKGRKNHQIPPSEPWYFTIEMTGCRWVEGEVLGGNFTYCNGRFAYPGSSWCEHHLDIVKHGSK